MSILREGVERIVQVDAMRGLVERVRRLEGEVDFLRAEQIRLSRQVYVGRSQPWWGRWPWLRRER